MLCYSKSVSHNLSVVFVIIFLSLLSLINDVMGIMI